MSETLTEQQKEDVGRLLDYFRDVMTDLQGNTTMAVHSVKVTTDDPIRSRPYMYPLPHALRDSSR